MSPDFKAPASESEFRRRSANVTVPGAEAMIKALENRKAAAVKPLDEEIAYYQKVIARKTGVDS